MEPKPQPLSPCCGLPGEHVYRFEKRCPCGRLWDARPKMSAETKAKISAKLKGIKQFPSHRRRRLESYLRGRVAFIPSENARYRLLKHLENIRPKKHVSSKEVWREWSKRYARKQRERRGK